MEELILKGHQARVGLKTPLLATPILFILFISINQELILIHSFIHLYHIHVLTGIPFHLKLLMHLLIMFSNVIYRVIISDNLIIVAPYSFAHVLICLIVIYLWVHFYISNAANCVSYA